MSSRNSYDTTQTRATRPRHDPDTPQTRATWATRCGRARDEPDMNHFYFFFFTFLFLLSFFFSFLPFVVFPTIFSLFSEQGRDILEKIHDFLYIFSPACSLDPNLILKKKDKSIKRKRDISITWKKIMWKCNDFFVFLFYSNRNYSSWKRGKGCTLKWVLRVWITARLQINSFFDPWREGLMKQL